MSFDPTGHRRHHHHHHRHVMENRDVVEVRAILVTSIVDLERRPAAKAALAAKAVLEAVEALAAQVSSAALADLADLASLVAVVALASLAALAALPIPSGSWSMRCNSMPMEMVCSIRTSC